MVDEGILDRIGDLVAAEKEMRATAGSHGLSLTDLDRLQRIEVELDQCWDLLNQRRALREFDRDPGEAAVRDEATVEGYEQ